MPSQNFSDEGHVKTLIQRKLTHNSEPRGTGSTDSIRFDELSGQLKKKKVMSKKTETLYLLYKIANLQVDENQGSELFDSIFTKVEYKKAKIKHQPMEIDGPSKTKQIEYLRTLRY